jgi:hypothetical protein
MTKYYGCLAAITLLVLVPNAEARVRNKAPPTGARLKFPTLERESNIRRVSSLRLAGLKWVLDSGLSAMTDVLSCPFTLVPTKLGRPPELI